MGETHRERGMHLWHASAGSEGQRGPPQGTQRRHGGSIKREGVCEPLCGGGGGLGDGCQDDGRAAALGSAGVCPSASRNLFIFSKRALEKSPEYWEFLYLCGNHWCAPLPTLAYTRKLVHPPSAGTFRNTCKGLLTGVFSPSSSFFYLYCFSA